jgi:predicted flap endonuclease-1-like 5' DNA nuclease
MELSVLQLGMMTAAALAGGGGVGWWLRGRFHSTQRVIMDELWTRKIKSYEATTAAAQEAQTLAATEQAAARKRMEQAIAEATEAQRQLAEQESLGGRLREALERHRERISEAAAEIERLHSALEAERRARQQDAERTTKLERRARSLAAYPARLEEREAELARLEVKVAELSEEKNAEIVRLTDWIAELTPLTETLKRRTEELAELQASRRADEQAGRLREEALRAELERHELALRKVGQRQQRLREERERDRVARVALERALAGLKATLHGERAAREDLGARLADERALVEQSVEREAELSTKLEALRADRIGLQRDLAAARDALARERVELTQLREDFRELELQAEPAQDHEILIPKGSHKKSVPLVALDPQPPAETALPVVSAEDSGCDDLTEIRGIGAKVAAKLETAGIRSFAQLAALEGSSLERLASEIAVPVKRIQREGWVDSARERV